jgi:membrane protease YdiL (CAAX protease family)
VSIARQEALIFVLYSLVYIAYLAWRPEGELLHWVTLVAVPVVLIRVTRAARGLKPTWREVLRSIGFGERPSALGIASALIIGVLLSCVQLVGRNGEAILGLIRSERALWLWPLSFLLMVATAAGTEELFFRGILQKRLRAASGSRLLAIAVATVLFTLYHVPYAYHNPGWGTQNDLGGSIRAAAETGLPLGILLGGVFAVAAENTVASVLAHALINSLPGMLVVNRLLDASARS